jgi:hypothetical protein
MTEYVADLNPCPVDTSHLALLTVPAFVLPQLGSTTCGKMPFMSPGQQGPAMMGIAYPW